MGTCGLHMVRATLIRGMVLVNILEVHSATNLGISGNQVSGKSFKLECSTRTTNTLNYASFFRSTNSRQSGTHVGYVEFYPNRTPSCRERTGFLTNYTVTCNSDGSMFTLTIPDNNTIEHKTYWRCGTDIDNRVIDNNVIIIFFTKRTESSPEGSITGPVIGAVLGGIVFVVLVVLGTLYLRGHWRDKGPNEDKTQISSENQLSTGDQGTPVYTNPDLTVTSHVEQDQQYQDLTTERSASTSAYQTLDIADTGVSDLDA